MEAHRSRDFAALALAALSVAAGLSLGRVFGGGNFALPVVGAALVPHLLGGIGRRIGWRLPVVLTTSTVALVGFATWVVESPTTFYGLPTDETTAELTRHLGDGYQELRRAVVPADVTDGALLLAIVATWVVAQTADVLAFARDGTVGAIAPALTLFVWSSSLGTTELRGRTTLGLAGASVVFLLLQHQALLEQRRARFAGRHLGTGTGLFGMGALAGVIAVVGGAVLGPALPGARSEALIDVREIGRGGSDTARSYETVPPLAGIGENFVAPERAQVFRVRSPLPEYWRIAALDRYTNAQGGQWTLSAQGDEVAERLDNSPADDAVVQEFEISALEGRWMPAAYRPVRVEGADVLVVKDSATLVTGSDSVRGLRYLVTSEIPTSPDALTEAERASSDQPVPAGLQELAALPGDFPADVRALADQITAGADTPLERARMLERFFLDPSQDFRYSLDADVELGPDAQSESAIREFVIVRRTGFCVQFAGSYAAMARAVGLPARVAVGYTPGDHDQNAGVFSVSNYDAHAWPEVWLGELGWTRFEPTPPSGLPGGSELPGTAPLEDEQSTAPTGAPTTAASPTDSPDASAAPLPAPGEAADVNIDAPGQNAPEEVGDDRGWFTVDWAVLAAAALALVLGAITAGFVVILRKARRRAQRRARPDPADGIAGAWEETLDRLQEVGVGARLAWTPFELATEASARLPRGAIAPLRSLAAQYTAVRYGPGRPHQSSARTAWEHVDEISSVLVSAASFRARWRRRLNPTPLRPRR